MPDEYDLTLRQADQARSDFAAIQSELEAVQEQLAQLPTRRNLMDMVIFGALWAAGLVLLGEWLLFR